MRLELQTGISSIWQHQLRFVKVTLKIFPNYDNVIIYTKPLASQYKVHQLLECGRCITESKWHNIEFKQII